MRLLLIMHYGTELSSSQFQDRQNALYSMARSFSQNVVTYVFGEKETEDEIKPLSLYGKLVYKGFGQISANLIVDEILTFINDESFDCIITEECELSNDIIVLLAAKMNLPFLTNVNSILFQEEKLEVTRAAYDNNLILKCCLTTPCAISLQGLDCRKYKLCEDKFDLKVLPFAQSAFHIINQELKQGAEKSKEAKLLIAVGMGVGKRTEIEKIRNFAISNGFGFGVTRPVAMNGFAKISEIIGVSGNIYAPKICITIGISGAAAFYVGIENSDFIMSINSNRDAPIVSQSDCAICDDYKNVCDRLFQILRKA